MYSGVYLRIILSNSLIQKVLILVLLTSTVPEVYFYTMATFISNSYYALEDTLDFMNSLKIKSYPVENVSYFNAEILVGANRLERSGVFKPVNFGCITSIFEDTADSIFYFQGFRSTRRLQVLSTNFACVTWMLYNQRILL